MYNLSTREKEVLSLLVDGKEYKEIAELLFISPFTVRKHISNIYEKLHVTSKTQAIKLMHQSRNSRSADTRNGSAGTYKILLVDDHQIILDSLGMMLSTIPELTVAGKISDSRNVVSFLERHEVDLMISDSSMPYMNGLKLVADVLPRFPELKTLMLTVSEDKEDIREAYALGVSGYVLKKASKEELKAAIRSVMRGERYFEAVPA
jgi:DNA-binding NarL/FixJ family response regulator